MALFQPDGAVANTAPFFYEVLRRNPEKSEQIPFALEPASAMGGRPCASG